MTANPKAGKKPAKRKAPTPRKPKTPKPETGKPVETPTQIPVPAPVTPAKPRRRGRPTLYSQPLAKALCKFLASGYTLSEVCRRPRMPYEPTVLGWARDPKHPFSDQYMRAREVGYMKMADDLVRIADDNSMDWIRSLDDNGNPVVRVDHDHIARARLRVDTRKWLLAKALPKIFGDKVLNEHTGKDGGPIQTKIDGPRPTGAEHIEELTQRFGKFVVHDGGSAKKA